MGIMSFISGLFKPAVDLIDELHVSDEERGQLHNELANIKAGVDEKLLGLMASEATSQHWIVAAWRPLTSICLVVAVVMDGHFGFHANANIYKLAELFLGVYAGGRSIEKLSSVFKK